MLLKVKKGDEKFVVKCENIYKELPYYGLYKNIKFNSFLGIKHPKNVKYVDIDYIYLCEELKNLIWENTDDKLDDFISLLKEYKHSNDKFIFFEGGTGWRNVAYYATIASYDQNLLGSGNFGSLLLNAYLNYGIIVNMDKAIYTVTGIYSDTRFSQWLIETLMQYANINLDISIETRAKIMAHNITIDRLISELKLGNMSIIKYIKKWTPEMVLEVIKLAPSYLSYVPDDVLESSGIKTVADITAV